MDLSTRINYYELKMAASRKWNSRARKDGVGIGIFLKKPCNTIF